MQPPPCSTKVVALNTASSSSVFEQYTLLNWLKPSLLLLSVSVFSINIKTQDFVFLFDGFLAVYEMYACMTKCGI